MDLLRVAMLVFNLAGCVLLYAAAAPAGHSAVQSAGHGRRAPDLAFNTAVSFITNTNWQAYGGETTMSYLVADGGPRGPELRLAPPPASRSPWRWSAALRAPARQGHRQLLGRPDARHALRAAAALDRARAVLCLAGRAAEPRAATSRRRRSKAPSRRSRRARWPRRSRSRCWAPTAAASSTPTPRIPTRTRRRCRTSSQMLAIFAIGAALTNTFGRMVGDERQGWAILAAMGVLFLAGVVVAYWAEAGGNPLLAALGVDHGRRQHGGQGGPLRHRRSRRSSP